MAVGAESAARLTVAESAGEELRRETAARLAAHRARRGTVPSPASSAAAKGPRVAKQRSAVAEAVAERYAHSPSYRAYLAEAAEEATRRAAAAAAIAARNAQAIARAEEELKDELELWHAPEMALVESFFPPPTEAKADVGDGETPVVEQALAGLTVRLYEDLGVRPGEFGRVERGAPTALPASAEEIALEEEIAFRQSPVFAEAVPAPVAIPGNLLEFPRQLVAARKARPVLALGPLRESAGPAEGQLRIFEVEPQEISTDPLIEAVEPEWQSIWLEARVDTAEMGTELPGESTALYPAPLNQRAMAAAMDGLLIAEGFIGFCSIFAFLAQRIELDLAMAAAGAGTLIVLTAVYYLMFFSLSEQTPGMRYARIGLCTFSDENPTRRSIRRRLLATAVAACPLGIGLLWALLDDDRLGWHDRISRMYQRAY